MRNTILLLLLLPILVLSQNPKLVGFENLIDKTWVAEGKWGDGSDFKQEIAFSYDLNKAIITTKTKGFNDIKRQHFGERNHGVRIFDIKTETVKFWEFDCFGNVTEGTVTFEGKNIMYQYQYGDSVITDLWEYIDDSTYNFIVGNYENDKWTKIYLETEFKLKN